MQKTMIFLFLLVHTAVSAQDFPAKPNTIVTDLTGTLNSEQVQSLESKLVAFDDSTSTQIAVLVIESTKGYDISEYSIQLLNKWGIGQAKKNNGVLLVVATVDRKVFIATGYGIEGVLPDALCKRIVELDIVPEFRKGDYYAGIEKGTTSIMKIVSGEFKADAYMKKEKERPVFFPIAMFLFIMAIVIFSRIGRVSRYARRNNLAFWAAWALLNAASSRSHGGSWGGFSGGGGFGGGFGGGGGGFGGFGGGGGGGGGAGGSW